MALKRLPFRDPRTVARDIPGVLDILFPRLSGGLVASLNRDAFRYNGLDPVPNELVEQSQLQKAMLFELAVARAELILSKSAEPEWQECIKIALERQNRHYDARRPDTIEESDQKVAEHAARNLVEMLRRISEERGLQIELSPVIPGMGWIASGTGDFAIGKVLIEVKHTDRNFVAGDFRQVLMYWLLKYASAIESDHEVWTDCLLLNPRRNYGLAVNFDKLLQSASSNSNRVELCEALRSIVEHDLLRR
ncbi:hypothetical protein [Leisingera sp. ANG-Vp]|uniref:hypothetical protein n=1 Tax=Leisingera sp. ANG-Vp TaxID=1577896 RepID=UPI00057E26A9|nr:hypothetical protein [Leisingera sp. ANG-Vp]KIC13708.1 hypothetical protein RA20_22685 [Leisingera sp. ANG-Vp]